MDTVRSTRKRFQIGSRNTSLFLILIFVLGFAVVSATIHRAYAINETATQKSVSQPVPTTQTTPQPKSVQEQTKDIAKPDQKPPVHMGWIQIVILIVTSILTSFTYPVLCAIYFKTLIRRRNEIDELLKSITMDKDLKLYGKLTSKDLKDLFKLYHNGKDYIFPVGLNMAAVSFMSIALILKWSNRSAPDALSIFDAVPAVAIVGFAGAYIFTHYDMIRRFSTMDLTPTIMYKSWLKLLITGIFGYLVSSTIKPDSLQLLVAFGLGSIPFSKLPDLIGRIALKPLNLSVETVVGDQPNLQKLQGLTEDVIDRLQEEGITTTQHLALADPILLLLKTNFHWEIILDMINQAVLYIFIGDKIEQLRTIGIRSATDIIKISRLKINEEGDKPKNGEKLIELISAKLGQDTIGTYNLIGNVADNPRVRLICNLLEVACEG